MWSYLYPLPVSGQFLITALIEPANEGVSDLVNGKYARSPQSGWHTGFYKGIKDLVVSMFEYELRYRVFDFRVV